MTLKSLRFPAVLASSTLVLGAMLLAAAPGVAQSRPAEPSSPYGGTTVQEVLARVNDQIITRSDYDRAMKDMDAEARQRGATMQEISEAHRDLLRNLVDQQLWLSKAKELGITGETELINRLNDIRKQYNLNNLEDLEKAAQEQGVSFEDFKANIRNQIITQLVMRDEVGRHVQFTQGEVQRFYEEHKQELAQPESVRLSEILVSTPADATQEQVDAAKAKVDDVEAKLKSGTDFAELARSSSQGTTAAQGGDLGSYKRGQLAKVFEDATFGKKTGDVTDPIRTKQGFVIFKVVEHNGGGIPAFADVQQQVEETYYTYKMEPAIRSYLTKMREDAYIDIKPGFEDTGASTNKRVSPIVYSAYAPPQTKKKKKVERTRYRENAHFRQKGPAAAVDETTPKAEKKNVSATTTAKAAAPAAQKPGKKEKIRYGKAPTKTLPAEPQGSTEDAGAGPPVNAETAQNTEIPLETPAAPEVKTRYSDRAKVAKEKKPKGKQQDFPDNKPVDAPTATEVADRQTQSQALGLGGNTANQKKKKSEGTTGEKTRYSEKKKTEEDKTPLTPTPIPAAPGAPAPTSGPTQQGTQPTPAPASQQQ
jgi:peptidyl-prolyl cis-trans isomerase SurA